MIDEILMFRTSRNGDREYTVHARVPDPPPDPNHKHNLELINAPTVVCEDCDEHGMDLGSVGSEQDVCQTCQGTHQVPLIDPNLFLNRIKYERRVFEMINNALFPMPVGRAQRSEHGGDGKEAA